MKDVTAEFWLLGINTRWIWTWKRSQRLKVQRNYCPSQNIKDTMILLFPSSTIPTLNHAIMNLIKPSNPSIITWVKLTKQFETMHFRSKSLSTSKVIVSRILDSLRPSNPSSDSEEIPFAEAQIMLKFEGTADLIVPYTSQLL